MPERSLGGEESAPLGGAIAGAEESALLAGEIFGGAMLSDAAERDVHRFIDELERRLSLQEKAAKEKQEEAEPSCGDMFQNDAGDWQVQFRGANPFRRCQRAKLGRNRSTPAHELVPSWKPHASGKNLEIRLHS